MGLPLFEKVAQRTGDVRKAILAGVDLRLLIRRLTS